MAGTFACPECGGEVALRGATPGRLVQCARCSAWLEVPYLPRGGTWTRPRFRRTRYAWAIPAAWAGVGLLALIVAAVAWAKINASRARASRDATLDALIASADAEERAGRVGRALSEVEAALALLGPDPRSCGGRLDELAARRDALSAREAEARIAAAGVPGAVPAAAVGDLLSLQARARSDRALEPLVPAILRATDAARARLAESELDEARRAVADDRPFDALAAGGRVLAVAEKIVGASQGLADEADRIMAPILARRGVVVVQSPGKFTLGTASDFEADLAPILVEGLRRRGYAPRPPNGPAREAWDRHAGLRLEFRVVETWGVLYLQSNNRLGQVVAELRLRRGPELAWRADVTGRTRVPLPDLPAHAAGRIALASRRDLDMEHRLYEDARAVALDRVAFQLRALPDP